MSETSAWRMTTAGLLAFMVGLTILLVAVGSYEFLRRQNEETQSLIAAVREDLATAQALRLDAERIALRSLRLEARRLRVAQLIETCTVARLQRQRVPRCNGVRADAARLARIIRAFRERLRERTIVVSTPAPGGGTTTRTVTVSPPPTRPPTVGGSDQCPPNNPQC